MSGQHDHPDISKKPGSVKPKNKSTVTPSTGEGWAVIMYDDSVHYREDVILQIMKALQCSIKIANGIVCRVERNGKGIVIITEHADAIRIAGILQEIRLKIELRKMV